MSYCIRNYNYEDKSRIIEIIDNVIGRKAAEKSQRRWEWLYEQNPHNFLDKPQILVLECNHKIVGSISSYPVGLKVKDKLVKAFWVGDFVIEKKHQGRGGLLLRNLLRQPYLFFATPNPNSYPLAKRLGAFDIFQPIIMIKVINPFNIIENKSKNKIIAIIAKPILNTYLKSLSLFNPVVSDENLSFIKVDRFDGQIDEFWQIVSKDYGTIVIRDKQYLNWRFIDYLGAGYEVYVAKENKKILGYSVFRYEESDGLKYGYIVDMLTRAKDKITLQYLIKKTVELINAKNVDLITCLISPYNSIYKAAFKKNGFIFSRRCYKFTALNNFDQSLNADLQNPRNWFLTRSDSDIDMA